MQRKSLFHWLPFRFAAFVAPLVAAWPQRSAAGDYVWDNAGVVITAGAATTVSWTATNTWNPDGQSPNNLWANAILNQTNAATPWGASLTASTVLNLDTGTSAVRLNSFRQINNGTAPTNPNNVTTNVVGSGGLTVNQIMMTAGGTLQFGPALPLTAVVDADYNPAGNLRVVNTDDSGLQLQGLVTVPGNLIKDGSGLMRLGTSGATFNNAIAGDILINNGTLQASNGASGNVLGGGGNIILNGPGSVLQLNAEYSAVYGRNVIVNSSPQATISADRSTATTGQTLSLGTVTVNTNNGYLNLNSANSYNLSLAGLAIGANNVNIRNGMNNTAGSETTGHALVGALSGSGMLTVSGSGGNSNQGLTFNAPSPGFTGTISLYEGGNHLVTAPGAFGSATVTVGYESSALPLVYPNPSIGSLASPSIISNPWSALLKYNTNNPSTAAVDVLVHGASQVNMGVVPEASDVVQLNRFAILQGSGAELAGFTAGTNLLLPASDAVISHETLGGADPAGLPLTASHYFGASANLNGPVTVGPGTPWKGLSNDRFARIFGGGATTVTVTGGDANPATTEVSIAALNQQTLTLLGTAGDKWASDSGQKFTVAIDGYGSAFGGLGAGGVPGGVVLLSQTAAASGLAAGADAIHVNGGTLQPGIDGAFGGVPVNVNAGGGVDIAGALSGALDAPVNVNSGGKLVLNDNVLMNAGANPININSGGQLWITGAAPANLLTGGSQPITFNGTGHTVRVATDNVAGLDAAVPNSGAVWEIASTGTSNNVASIWGTTFAVNTGRTVVQSAGLSTDGGVITNDNGTRFLDAPLTIGNNGAVLAASTGTSLVFGDSASGSPVVAGTGASAGQIPLQIGSLSPVNLYTKTENPVLRSNNADGILLPHNSSPQVMFSNGLKSGPVNLVTGSLALDGPAANNAIAGDLTMGENTRLYLGDGGNIATGNGYGGAAPRRGDLTPLLMGSGVTGPGNRIILGNYSRVELGVDSTDPAFTDRAAASGGRGQIDQSFVITGDVNPDDRRSFWVNRAAGSTTTAVDFNDITIRNNGHIAFQESNTDVRAVVRLETGGTASPFSAWDFKAILNVDSTGAPATAPKTLNLGVAGTAFQAMSLYGMADTGVTVNNVNARFEVRDGAYLSPGFIFNDNADARRIVSVQNTTNGGPYSGSDHTLSFIQGHGGVSDPDAGGTFNLNRDNAAGGYVDEAAAGSSPVNTVYDQINVNAAGATLFADRFTDNTLTGVVKYDRVAVNAPNVSLATRNGTDLEVGNLTVNRDTVVRADGARTDSNTDAVGSIRVGNVAAAANGVHFQNGRTTITGNVTAGVVTAGGTSLELNPGSGNTSVLEVAKVQVNSMLAAKSGSSDFGSANLESSPAGTLVAGLREGVINGTAIDVATANPADSAATANGYDSANLGIRLDPRIAQNNYSAAAVTDTAAGWSNNQTWVYTGQIFDADGRFSLAENIDDSVSIRIDGRVVLFNRNSGSAAAVGSNAAAANGYTPAGGGLASGAGQATVNPNESYRTVTATGTKDGLAAGAWQANSSEASLNGILADTTLANANEYGGTLDFGAGNGGWHDIEIRIQNGTGGASSPNTLGFGNYFGLGLNSDGSTSLLGTDYTKPVDDGTMNLFRTTTVAKGNVDIDNDAAVLAGSVKNIGTLTFGRNGLAGDAALTLRAAAAGSVDVISIPATATGAALLDVVSAAGKVSAGQFNLADTETLEFNTSAGSLGELQITGGSAVTANSGGVVTMGGGTLRLSNLTGSATGSALLMVNGGSLEGNGSTGSPVMLAGSGSIAPGDSTGILTFGTAEGLGLSASGGSVDLEIAGSSAVPDGSLYDVVNVKGSVDLGSGTVLRLSLSYEPAAGDAFWVLLNDGVDPVAGRFSGLAEGSLFTSGGKQFRITYEADGQTAGVSSLTGGNDVALVYVPEPGSTALAAAAGLLGLARRRRSAV